MEESERLLSSGPGKLAFSTAEAREQLQGTGLWRLVSGERVRTARVWGKRARILANREGIEKKEKKKFCSF